MIRKELPILRAQLTAERQRLQRVADEIALLVANASGRELTRIEVVAGAAYLHTLYNGVENLLLRIAHAVDESVPEGADWHRVLVDQMLAPAEGLRPALLDEPLARQLDEYRRFRHAFRHTYFFDLDGGRVHPLLAKAPELVTALEAAVEALFAALAKI